MLTIMPLKLDAVRVEAIRKRKRLTQGQVAVRGGLAARTVAEIAKAAKCIEEGNPEEAPKLDVRLSTVTAMARGLGVRPLDILVDPPDESDEPFAEEATPAAA